HVKALVAHPLTAIVTAAARQARIDGDAPPFGEAGDTITDCGDHTCDLMAQRHWLLDTHRAEAAVMIVVQIRSADPAIGDLDAHLARFRRGIRKTVDPQVLRRVNDDGAHCSLP